jgi:arylsulfatase
MSMLTSLYPESHGVLVPAMDGRTVRLPRQVDTLAEVLREAGYATAGFTDGLLVDHKFGFSDGFDLYHDRRHRDFEKNGFRKYRGQLHRWIRRHAGRKQFVFVHTYDVHGPYPAPPQYRARFAEASNSQEGRDVPLLVSSMLEQQNIYLGIQQYAVLQDVIDRYDASIAFVDDQLGELFGLLRDLGLWDEALVVVTSDHGENLLDRGPAISHGFYAHNEETLVPLLFKFPGGRLAGQRIEAVVESIDIMPTILAALDIPAPHGIDGQSLLSGLEQGRWQKTWAYGSVPGVGGYRYLLRDGVKYLEGMRLAATHHQVKSFFRPHMPEELHAAGEEYEIRGRRFRYDFDADPLGIGNSLVSRDQAFDLSQTRYEKHAPQIRDPELLAALRQEIERISRTCRAKYDRLKQEAEQGPQLAPDQMRQLEALGYLGLLSEGEGGARSHPGQPVPAQLSTLPTTDPPLSVREQGLLEEGDRSLWVLKRLSVRESDRPATATLQSHADAARLSYGQFLGLRPDCHNLVSWRLRYVDILLQRPEEQ